MRSPVKNFQISAQGVFRDTKTAKMGIFEGCLCASCSSNDTISSDGIISAASRHPKDVPFVREFWWRTYGMGAISPRITQILAIAAVDCAQQVLYTNVQLALHGLTSLAWGQHALFEPILLDRLQCIRGLTSPQTHCNPSSDACNGSFLPRYRFQTSLTSETVARQPRITLTQ